jgi:anti-sigma factor RsiW
MSHVDEGLLHAYLDGELTPVERARVDEHLAGCLACRTRLDEERQLIERASKLLGFAAPLERPAPPLHQLERPKLWWHVRMPLAWAATIVLAVGLTWTAAVEFLPSSRRAPDALRGPIALHDTQPPPADKPAAPAPSATGRLDVRSMRAYRERQEPSVAQKPSEHRDTNATDELRSVTPAAERDAAGAGSVAAPAPAPAANLATRNPEVRLQAVTIEAPAPLDSAAVRKILGREPLVIPGLTVRSITRSPRAPNEVMVEQALDSTQVIVLYESRQTMTSAFAQRDRVSASETRAPTAAAKAIPEPPPGRLIGDVMVEIQARVSADSLQKLLGRIKP